MSGLVARLAGLYQKNVGKSLRMYGIKYDDALVDVVEVQAALELISKDEKISRTRRIARAADCSMKRTYLSDEIQNIQRPFDNYIYERVKVAAEIQDERAALTKW